MRILSQDGMIDIPYDITALNIWDNHDSEFRKFRIYAHMRNQGGRPLILAKYSTEPKAKRAMEMLRTAYVGKFITNADVPEDFNEQLKELMKGGFGTVLVKETNDSRIEFNNLNGYFQFPADDELEG